MNEQEKLLAALRAADFIVSFSPLPNEPNVGDFLKKNQVETKGHSVLADKNISPHDFAGSLSKIHKGEKIVVLVPGREFDMLGTRHGRGGGWYDRFLSEVPREWLRVGVLTESQLSDTPLKRESWDEPMDYLLILNTSEWSVIEI